MRKPPWNHWDRKFFGHVYAVCGHVRAMSDKCAEAVYIGRGAAA